MPPVTRRLRSLFARCVGCVVRGVVCSDGGRVMVCRVVHGEVGDEAGSVKEMFCSDGGRYFRLGCE